jgi:hypothetical protein
VTDIKKVSREGLRVRAQDDMKYHFKDSATVYCLHCMSSFKASEVLYDAADGLLVCPNEGCDGNPMDWSKEDWARPWPDPDPE